jgi:hypothetical protein
MKEIASMNTISVIANLAIIKLLSPRFSRTVAQMTPMENCYHRLSVDCERLTGWQELHRRNGK